MGILRVDHPDILNFIRAKDQEGVLNNFNLSIAVTDRFMEAVERDEDFPLINPRTKDVTRVIKARTIFDLAAASAWNGGDPGIIFIDEVNRGNPTPSLGPIESTNPCGEQPLLPYESCNLGSINLSRMLKDGAVDWEKLERVVVTSVRFLDNVIERTNFPNPKISKITKANRKIGLGVMGFSDMLAQLKVCYDSTEAVDMAERLMKFISSKARETSVELGRRRGSFQNFDKSIWMERGFPAMRNASLTAIAPTGTISIIANTSSGIEPFFGVVFVRNVLGGTQFLEVNPVFEYEARKGGFLTDGLLAEIARRGSTKDVEGVPPDIQKLFQTSFEVAPSRQLEIQAAFQRYTDSSVSKTINIPSSATIDDVKEIFLLAYKLKCKGITVYRYGSRKDQALYFGRSKEKAESLEYMNVYGEYSGGCLRRECLF
jgi:ribonucleoside-diphosphate reductase alpha chain